MKLEDRLLLLVSVVFLACHDATEPTPLQGPVVINASISSDLTRSFVVGEPRAIDDPSLSHSFLPDLGATGSGAIAVWRQFDGSHLSIFANRSLDGDWDTPFEIDHPALANASNPRIASNSAGHALAVWEQVDATLRLVIVASMFDGQSWNQPLVIDDDLLSHSQRPQPAVDGSGNAWVLWEQFDTATIRLNVMANHFDGAAWGSPLPIDDPTRHNAFRPHIATATDGSAVAIWQQFDVDANRWVVMASFFHNGAWTGAVAIDDPSLTHSSNPRVATSAAGLTVAVWEQFDGSRLSIMANVFDGQAWSGPVVIDDPLSQSRSPQVAMDSGGDATAVWQQFDPGIGRSVITASHLHGTAWTNPVVVDDTTRSNSQLPHVAMGGRGQATLVWHQFHPESNRLVAMANVFDGTRWGTPTAVDDPARSNSQNARVTVNSAGHATVVWEQFDADANRQIVMANSIRPPTPADQVTALTLTIDDLESNGTLSPVLASTLRNPLDRALTRISNGQPILAAINLNLFIALVRLYEVFDLLPTDDAEVLIEIAQMVVDELLMAAQQSSNGTTGTQALIDRNREAFGEVNLDQLDRELSSLVHDGHLTRLEAHSFVNSLRDLLYNRPQ